MGLEASKRAPGEKEPEEATIPAAAKRPDLIARLSHVIVHNILRLDDTPHRIALGVFLGTLIGFAPIMGLQTIVLIAAAALFRANKLSGLPVVWITNPLTAVPFYYGCWRFGAFLLTGHFETSPTHAALIRQLIEVDPGTSIISHFYTRAFWDQALALFLELGTELWVGCFVLGTFFGLILYWVTYRSVITYRERKRTHPNAAHD
ncbi:MAG: DUF2062 domain-containing protein [Deltaproteobacteria bacterium]|nr:DUF2062 domain-containing protein [Deltaproteobacteria bacterium]